MNDIIYSQSENDYGGFSEAVVEDAAIEILQALGWLRQTRRGNPILKLCC